MKELPPRAQAYVFIVVMAGLAAMTSGVAQTLRSGFRFYLVGPIDSPHSVLAVVCFVGLAAVANAVIIVVPEEDGKRNRQTLNAVGNLAMAVVFPVYVSVVLAAIAKLLEQGGQVAAGRRRKLHRSLFNVAMVSLSTGAASLLFNGLNGGQMVGGPYSATDGLRMLASALGAVSAAYVMGYGLFIWAAALSSRVSAVRLFFHSYRPTILPEATAGIVGVVFGYLWLANPALCPIALLPLAVIYLAFKNFVRLQELDRLKSNFITEVSHELRTPLSAILASSELMYHHDGRLTLDDVHELSRSTYESSNHLYRLVENLLNATTLQSGTLHIRPVSVSLDELVADAIVQVQPFMESKHQQVSVNMPDDLPEVLADPQHIIQVLINLLTNASKYSPPETTINVGCEVQGEAVRVAVSDQGIGIPEEEQTHIFERFYRVPATTMTSVVGSGLGLSIVKSLVELHRGNVGVSSKPGVGSVFWFTLPQVWAPASGSAS